MPWSTWQCDGVQWDLMLAEVFFNINYSAILWTSSESHCLTTSGLTKSCSIFLRALSICHLKNWQAGGINHLSKKPIPGFDQSLANEVLANVQPKSVLTRLWSILIHYRITELGRFKGNTGDQLVHPLFSSRIPQGTLLSSVWRFF